MALRFRRIGDWSVNRSGPSGSAGFYLEADLPPKATHRYAAVDPGYADLYEEDIARLARGEWVEIPLLDEDDLVERIDSIPLK